MAADPRQPPSGPARPPRPAGAVRTARDTGTARTDAVRAVRILGVDPGSRVCGYGVIDAGGEAGGGAASVRYVECGVLTAGARAPMEARLGEIARWLQDVVTELGPTVMAVEDVFSRVNPRTALALAQARGVVLAVAGMSGLSVCSYPPAVVKKTVTGRGRAGKEQVSRMVQALIGLRAPPRSDAADALAVAITHARRAILADATAWRARPSVTRAAGITRAAARADTAAPSRKVGP